MLVLACLALGGGLLACGGGGDDDDGDGAQLLRETFASSETAIRNAAMDLTFQLDPDGLLALGGPIKLELAGPFAAARRGELPRFDIDLGLTLNRQIYRAGIRSTGGRAFVTVDGTAYQVDDRYVADVRRGLPAVSAGSPQPGLRALGFDPLRWIEDPEEAGRVRVDGTEAIRVTGTVDVAGLLDDLDRLITRAGGRGGGSATALLDATARRQLAAGASTATAEVRIGADDKILRQLAVRIDVDFGGSGESPIPGLLGGTINLRLALDDVNETTVDGAAPQRARPISGLTGGSVGNFLRGIGAGLTSGARDVPDGRLLRCVTGADGNTTSLVRCVSGLAP